jgi:AcrR family transcriptional regulator
MASESRSNPKRPYRKRRRAEHEAETRQRITEAAVDLHGSVGPARTTVKAVAERAGVQRATVYRHFPTEEALFAACSAHWASLNPPPDSRGWGAITDPDARLRLALTELYEWFEWAEPMLSRTLRDAPLVPAMDGVHEASEAAFAQMQQALTRGRRERGRRRERIAAAIGHVIAFSTWQSLARVQGLDRGSAIDLACELVAASARMPAR